jgi:hypothetical protein
MNAKQKYAIYRDDELIVSEITSLAASGIFASKDARREHDQGRPARYTITGSLGFSRRGSHFKGRLRWEEGELRVGLLPETGVLV